MRCHKIAFQRACGFQAEAMGPNQGVAWKQLTGHVAERYNSLRSTFLCCTLESVELLAPANTILRGIRSGI